MGSLHADKALLDVVSEMAVRAATEDPDHRPMQLSELREVDIEISVLSELKPVVDARDIEIGRDGIYVVRGSLRGVLLPQVATDHGWNAEEFLVQACQRAGMTGQAWRESGTQTFRFSATVFSDRPGFVR